MPRIVSHPGVHIEEIAGRVRPIPAAPTSVTAFVGRAAGGPIDEPVAVRSVAEYRQRFGEPSSSGTMGRAVDHFFGNGGTDAVIVRVSGGDADPVTDAGILGSRDARTGIHALDGVDSFNLLCIPPLAPDTDVDEATWAAAAAYCRERGAMLIVDSPTRWGADPATAVVAAEAGVNRLRRTVGNVIAADVLVAFPRVEVRDPSSGRRIAGVAPCGAIAGVIARTDARRGVWKAPAGREATLHGVSGLAYGLNDAENGVLNRAGLVCLRSFSGAGHVVWGARTLAGADALASEWKYVPVRRLALFLERSLHRGMQWAVFEQNGEPLWARLRASVEAFMRELFRQGTFRGASAREAYFVRCDGSTTTQGEIDRGIVNVVVGFAPTRPAEFVVLTIRQKTAEAA